MRRIGLAVVLAVSLFVAPLAAETQQAGKMYRIGYLSTAASMDEPFPQALRELGYVEGRNLILVVRLAAGRLDRLPALAAELVSVRVDMIVAVSPPAIQAAKLATTSIPIVMAFTSRDPVERGFVESLAHPGHNITGVAMIADEITGKRLGLLREVLPRAAHLAVLAQKGHSTTTGQLASAQEAARTLGIQLDVVEVRDARDYLEAFDALKHAPGLFILSNPTFSEDRQSLVSLALKDHLPTLCEWREMVEAGCLMSYGANLLDLSRRAVTYVDRIARGAPAADLPIERPTKFELVINLKTAKALGLTIPQTLLLRADQVIE